MMVLSFSVQSLNFHNLNRHFRQRTEKGDSNLQNTKRCSNEKHKKGKNARISKLILN